MGGLSSRMSALHDVRIRVLMEGDLDVGVRVGVRAGVGACVRADNGVGQVHVKVSLASEDHMEAIVRNEYMMSNVTT